MKSLSIRADYYAEGEPKRLITLRWRWPTSEEIKADLDELERDIREGRV